MGRAVSAFRGFVTWWNGCIPQCVINCHVHPPHEHLPVISALDWWIWDSFPGCRLSKLEVSPLSNFRTALGFLAKEKSGPCINH